MLLERRQPSSYRRSTRDRSSSTRDRSRRAALLVLAGSSPRLAHSRTHRKIAGGVSRHSPRQISYAASPFSFLRLDSCREQATKKTPDEEPAKEVHCGSLLVCKLRYIRRLERLR